jgi:hypothetical protein
MVAADATDREESTAEWRSTLLIWILLVLILTLFHGFAAPEKGKSLSDLVEASISFFGTLFFIWTAYSVYCSGYFQLPPTNPDRPDRNTLIWNIRWRFGLCVFGAILGLMLSSSIQIELFGFW